jgi:hypothetical protein
MTSFNLEAATNADWRQPFEARDADGALLNLTGAAIQMDVRTSAGEAILDLSLGHGLKITSAASGWFEVEVAAAVMSALPLGVHRFDILIEIDGLRQTAARGTVHVREGVTEWDV